MAYAPLSKAIWKAPYAVGLAAALLVPVMARSASFPEPLLGKSVTVTWTVNRQQKFERGGIASRTLNFKLRIYISTAGRAFSKEDVSLSGQGGRRSGNGIISRTYQDTRAPDDSGESAYGTNHVDVEGRALVVDRILIEGAQRVSVTFDAGYSSCNARIILGKEGGAGTIRMRSHISLESFEVLSSTRSIPDCAVTPGNVFGGE